MAVDTKATEAALLAEIRDNPDDNRPDGPKGIYADFLDDEGRSQESAVIRLCLSQGVDALTKVLNSAGIPLRIEVGTIIELVHRLETPKSIFSSTAMIEEISIESFPMSELRPNSMFIRRPPRCYIDGTIIEK